MALRRLPKSPRVQARIKDSPGDSWITGRNWDQSLWPGGTFPTAAALDGVSPDRPVWLERVDGHAGWANTEAMRRAKRDSDSKAPSDGQIVRDSAGNPTGVLIDGAMNLVARAVPDPTLNDVKRRLLRHKNLCFKTALPACTTRGSPIASPKPIASSIAKAGCSFGFTPWPQCRPVARFRF